MGLRIWGGLLLVAAALATNGGARAQAYPDRPVRILIAFPAGGTIDTLGRILAQKLTEAWGQNVVIENRPGGGGNIGAAAAAKTTPDGYTLHFGAQTLGVNVTLQPSKRTSIRSRISTRSCWSRPRRMCCWCRRIPRSARCRT
jgi:tripartite-type tricarboxylate transporter receptor subunit TctC